MNWITNSITSVIDQSTKTITKKIFNVKKLDDYRKSIRARNKLKSKLQTNSRPQHIENLTLKCIEI